MQRRTGKMVLAMAAAVMLLVTVFFAANRYVKNPFIKKDTSAKAETGEEKTIEDGQNTADESFPVSQRWNRILPYEGNTVKIGEPFVAKKEFADVPFLDTNMEICVNEVCITKERVDTDAMCRVQEDPGCPIRTDEENNILNEYNYVVVNVTMRNLREEDKEFYVNSFTYFPYDPETEDWVKSHYIGELQGYKTAAEPYQPDKSYARIIIPGGGEYTCNLVYMQEDESIEGKIPYLFYSFSGMVEPYDDQARFVRLDQ